ncbi:unnamed protein product [Ectocarpus sp. 12 AP-2014]
MLPSLRGSWSARLRRAAPLLAIESSALQSRLEGLADLFPPDADLQAIVNQTPLLLRHRTEKMSEALANIERLVPGLRMDRVLRSAPQLLVQPLDVVEKRLAQLRAVLRLTPSPELERMRISLEPNTSNDVSIDSGSGSGQSGGGDRDDDIGNGGGGGGGGGVGGRPVGVRRLARFANGFPQILTMEPHTVRAKVEGLEALLPGMDGLALVGSRPHVLGFDVRRNVSLKVSRLRELMMDRSLPQQRRGQQETSTMADGADASDDLVAAVARCPSLLTLSSDTSMRKVEKLQEALPSGLVARTIVAKEPRVMSLDMASTVPRKLADLARAFAEHAGGAAAAVGGGDSGSGDDDDEAAAAVMMAQTLRYNPNALRFDPATLARKLGVLRGAGLSAETVCRVVGGAPRCLSAAAGTLEARVSTLKEAFPSVPLSRLLGEAPCLLQKTIDPVAKIEVLQELFPSLDPVLLVEGAPMLLALSEKTLRVKRDAWRSILEDRVDVPWEQVVADFPQLLCQGLGRAARVPFLLLDDPPTAASAATMAVSRAPPGDDSERVVTTAVAMVAAGGVGDEVLPATHAPGVASDGVAAGDGVGAAAAAAGGGSWRSGVGKERSAGGGVDGGSGVAPRTMSAAAACREICRRVSDFESDHPSYPCFLDSLLVAAAGHRGAGDSGGGGGGGGASRGAARVEEEGEGVLVGSSAPMTMSLGRGGDGVATAVRGVQGAVTGNQRQQRYRWQQQQQQQPRHHRRSRAASAGGAAATAREEQAADPAVSRRAGAGAAATTATTAAAAFVSGGEQLQRSSRDHSSRPRPQPVPIPLPSTPLPPSALSAGEARVAVKSEKALGAAMAEAARGPGGGAAAAAMLIPPEAEMQDKSGRSGLP